MKNESYVTTNDVEQYTLLYPLIHGLYVEVQELSKKKPESPLNNSKIKMVNRILEPIKELMKNEPVFGYLDILDIDDIPTNSDVILILSHYLKAMNMFRDKYYENSPKGKYTWAVK